MVTRKLTSRAARSVGAVAVLAAMALGSVPAMAMEVPDTFGSGAQSGGNDSIGGEIEDFVSEDSDLPLIAEVSGDDSDQGSLLGHSIDRAASQSREIEDSQDSEVFVGSVYDDPNHADVVTFIDEETGEEYTVRSGITHWEEADASKALSKARMGRAATPHDVFTDITLGAWSGAEALLHVKVSLPDHAVVGDSWEMKINDPFWFKIPMTSVLQLKDANGNVFAVAQTKDKQSMTTQPRYGQTLVLTATEDADAHVGVSGFVELHIGTFDKNKLGAQSVTPKLTGSDGTVIFTGAAHTIPKAVINPVSNNPSSVTRVIDNKPAVGVGVQLNNATAKPGATWTVVPAASAVGKVTPVCDSPLPIDARGYNAAGWFVQQGVANAVDVVSCNTTTGKVVLKIDGNFAPPTGWTDTYFTAYVPYITEKESTPYSFTLSGAVAGTTTPTSGKPVTAGGSGQAIVTTKTATYTTQSGDSKPTVGDTITYKITTKLKDPGMDVATGIVTTDKLPAGLEFISATGGGKYNSASRNITWGPFVATATGVTYTVKAKIISLPTSANIKNTVSNEGDVVCTEHDDVSVCEADVLTPVAKPGFEFTKSSTLQDTNKNGYLGDLGDTIVYKFSVKNTGETTLSTAKFSDDLLNIKNKECLTAPLKPGATATCAGTYTHTITEADVDAGKVTNHATMCVDPAYGLACEPGETTEKTVDPSFAFVKHSKVVLADDARGFDGAIAGDKIDYWFTVSNTGNVALKNVTIDDDLLGLNGAACVSALPVGAKDVKCSTVKTYTITEADQEAGVVTNHALGKVPGLPDEPGDTTDPTVDPSFEFDKSVVEIVDSKGKPVTGGKAVRGDKIHFGFSAKNTGNVDINTLKVTDPLLGVSGVECLAEGEVLEVGEVVDCVDNASYWHTVTGEDVTAGKVHNVATGSVPGLPDEPGETTTPVLPDPVLPELPQTGAGGTWLVVGAGTLMTLGGAYALLRRRRVELETDGVA